MTATYQLPVITAWVNDRAREQREADRIASGYYRDLPDATGEDEVVEPEDDSLDDNDDEAPEHSEEEAPESHRDRRAHEQALHPGGSPRRMTTDEQDELDVSPLPTDHPRPRTRRECIDGARPCPYAACEHHLYLDVDPKGHIRLNFPGIGPDEMGESCALDVADRRSHSFDEVGNAMNLTYERVRQIEEVALRKLKRDDELRAAVKGDG
jgi:hypothetical protein